MPRKLVILTQGHSNPHTAKTACCLIRYRREDVVAVLDSTQRGKSAQHVLGVGADVPIVGALVEAPQANALLIGIAPPGGKIPQSWRPIILEAIERGMAVISGLHDFLTNDEEFVRAAAARGVQLVDVRRNNERDIARRVGLRPDCLRIHTVGHDCSVGKMVVALELTRALQRRGRDAKFLATGQTGIMVSDEGCPVDCVVADFVSGAIEKLVLQNQHHDILLIEGQGSLVHPSYSGVTLGLLHGCAPHGLILCYEVGRETVTGIPSMKIPPLREMRRLNEMMASVMQPCEVIGVAMNSWSLSPESAEMERSRVREELQLPVCDVIRHGPDELADAVVRLQERLAGT